MLHTYTVSRPHKHLAWKYDGYWDWRDDHLNWSRLVYQSNHEGDKFRDNFNEMLDWCYDNLAGDWNTFNSSMWAFEQINDAMLFKLRWGHCRDGAEWDQIEVERQERNKAKFIIRKQEYLEGLENGSIDPEKDFLDWCDVVDILTGEIHEEWAGYDYDEDIDETFE